MATHTTLNSLFTDIADSIREKTGENRQLVADNFPEEIDAIQTGGGIEDVSTSAEMDAKKIISNRGKMYHYVGTTTTDYVNGRYYLLGGGIVTLDFSQIGSYYVWQNSSIVIPGIDTSYQHGAYESTNYNKHSSYCVCKIKIQGFTTFTLWINSYAESNYDYTIASKLDAASIPTAYTSTYVKGHTRGFQKNPTSGLTTTYWKKITYTSADGIDENEHFIYVIYRKDNSTHSNNDRGYFVYEDGGLQYKEYLYPNGTSTITENGTYDVKDKASVVVNTQGITPSGSQEFTSNGTYDVTNLAEAVVNVAGGSSGFKVYLYHKIQSVDGGVIKINGTAVTLTQQMPDTTEYNASTTIMTLVNTIKLYGFDHCGSYPSGGSSWARYRPHSGGDWTNINITRTEDTATEITLNCDIDLEILEATCLNKGTPILMADGTHKPIEEIEVGDLVMGYDGQPNKVRKSQKGSKQFGEERDVWIFENDIQIITTYRHEFYNLERCKMTYLDEWKEGEHGYTEKGEKVALLKHIHEDIPCQHFSLWCEHENYFAGGLLAGNRYTEKINL